MIDLHSHLLPAVDDGPRSVRGAVKMARLAVETGVATQVCTPHMHPRYPTEPGQVHDAIAALAPELARKGIPLELLPGAEIDIGFYRTMDDEALARSSLGGGPWLLVEMPFAGWPLDLADLIRDAELRGYGVVLAHPERAESVQANPDRLRDAVGRGALCQLTASSFTGDHGARALRTAATLVRSGLAHLLATDAHGPRWRPPDLDEGLAGASDATGIPATKLAWMVEDGPAAIVEGRDVRPPRFSGAPPGPRSPERERPGSPGQPRPSGR